MTWELTVVTDGHWYCRPEAQSDPRFLDYYEHIVMFHKDVAMLVHKASSWPDDERKAGRADRQVETRYGALKDRYTKSEPVSRTSNLHQKTAGETNTRV